METALAIFGGILLLFGLGVGTLMKTNLFQPDQSAPKGDRISAGIIGIAVVLRIDAPTGSQVSTFGVTAGLTLLYVLYLLLARPE